MPTEDRAMQSAFKQPLWRHIGQAISDLPLDEQELIGLRNFAGATWDAIAEQTGRDGPDAARVAHGQAMAELKRHFNARSMGVQA